MRSGDELLRSGASIENYIENGRCPLVMSIGNAGNATLLMAGLCLETIFGNAGNEAKKAQEMAKNSMKSAGNLFGKGQPKNSIKSTKLVARRDYVWKRRTEKPNKINLVPNQSKTRCQPEAIEITGEARCQFPPIYYIYRGVYIHTPPYMLINQKAATA